MTTSNSEPLTTDEEVKLNDWAPYFDHPDRQDIAYVRERGSSLYDREICVIYSGDRKVARLLAAAPDLLASLKSVREYMDDPRRECPLPTEIASALRIAIAKAEGRS